MFYTVVFCNKIELILKLKRKEKNLHLKQVPSGTDAAWSGDPTWRTTGPGAVPVKSRTSPSMEYLVHVPGSLKCLAPGQHSIDGLISFYHFTLFLPWIHSVWLPMLLANKFALVSWIPPRTAPLMENGLFAFQL